MTPACPYFGIVVKIRNSDRRLFQARQTGTVAASSRTCDEFPTYHVGHRARLFADASPQGLRAIP
jgi:hypothetical protein